MSPSMQRAGGSVWCIHHAKHILKDIPEAEWEKSDYVRGTNSLVQVNSMIESIVAGESVTLVPNEHYYKGVAKVDKVVMEVVSPDNIVSEMKAGNYDIATMPKLTIRSIQRFNKCNVNQF